MAIKRNPMCDFRLGEYHPAPRDRNKPRLWHKDQQDIAARTLRNKEGHVIVCSSAELAQWVMGKIQDEELK